MHSATTPTNLSPKSGSVDSLNVSVRCGSRPRAAQSCCTFDLEIAACLAIERTDQWVSSGGVACWVSCTTWSALSWKMVGLRRRPGRTLPTPSAPSSTNCEHYPNTMERDATRHSVIFVLATPSAANNRPFASRTIRCGSDGLAALFSNACHSSSSRSTGAAGG